jgi:GMP synthase (glutamine-hydrolysing)
MRTAIAIRHVAFEDLGAFAIPIEAAGYRIQYVDIGYDEFRYEAATSADLLVVLGGPIGAYEADLYPFIDQEIKRSARGFHKGSRR